jgi:hypothetical protein
MCGDSGESGANIVDAEHGQRGVDFLRRERRLCAVGGGRFDVIMPVHPLAYYRAKQISFRSLSAVDANTGYFNIGGGWFDTAYLRYLRQG